MILTLLGAPGSGKGTQGRLLAERFGIPYLSSGDLLRRAIDQGTPLGQRAQSFVTSGQLVPDEVLVPVVVEQVVALCGGSNVPEHSPQGVLDGFPRTRPQAEALDAPPAPCGGVGAALMLNVPEDVVLTRLAGRIVCTACGTSFHLVTKPPQRQGVCDECGGALHQRSDDGPDTVRRRLAVYQAGLQPLVHYYRQRGCLAEIDGNAPESVVAARLVDAVEARVRQVREQQVRTGPAQGKRARALTAA